MRVPLLYYSFNGWRKAHASLPGLFPVAAGSGLVIGSGGDSQGIHKASLLAG